MKGWPGPIDCWGKFRSVERYGPAWHPLVDHCTDVACVLEALLAQPTIRRRLARAGGFDDLDSEAPPLTRGWTPAASRQVIPARGSPAHAGMDPVAIGAMVALIAPMVTTLYQGRPADTARTTIDHQTRLDEYGALSKAVATAERTAKANDEGALNTALREISSAAATLYLLLDQGHRKELQDQQTLVAGSLYAGRTRLGLDA